MLAPNAPLRAPVTAWARPPNVQLSAAAPASHAPERSPARYPGPPLWKQAAELHWDDILAPAPEYVFDQRVSW